jgi:hypothetical protein
LSLRRASFRVWRFGTSVGRFSESNPQRSLNIQVWMHHKTIKRASSVLVH